MKSYRKIIFVPVIALAILLQLANPTLARADGGTEPPPPTEAAAEPPPDLEEAATEVSTVEPIATEAPVAPEADVAPTDNPDASMEVVATELPIVPEADAVPMDDPTASPDTAASKETSLPEIIQQLPAQTDIIVLDETGQALPLATQEAAAAIVSGDPWWCPGTSAPGSVDCATGSGSKTSFTDPATGLLTWMSTNATPGGTIWIAYDYDSAAAEPGGITAITIDGGSFAAITGGFLTIQGGWDGNPNSSGAITTMPSVFSGDSFSVTNWKAAVTINNITVDGASTTNAGLNVVTTGDINLADVTVTGDTVGDGAFLNNSSGTGNVTLTGTNVFNNNRSAGLHVNSNGNITLNNISANENARDGALLATSGGNVTLTGTNVFNNNGYVGLEVDSSGNITAENITANGNAGDGAYLCSWWFCPGVYGTGNVTLTGRNVFNNNGSAGLRVLSRGNITLNNISANGNDSDGAIFGNGEGTGNVTLTGTNVFNDNNGHGFIVGSNGNINLNSITANNNGDNVWLNNCNYWAGPFCNGWGDVILTGTNVFNNNEADGLHVLSNGDITLNNISANRNGGSGAYLNTDIGTGNVTLTGTNVFNNNGTNGLVVYSHGNITLKGITANYNGGNGVYLFTPDNATINNSTIKNNANFGVDASAVCGTFSIDKEPTAGATGGSYNPPAAGDHSYTNPVNGGTVTIHCKPKVYIAGKLVSDGEVAQTLSLEASGPQFEFTLSCASQNSFFVALPNGDQIQIVCPVSGKALIKRLDNPMLPAGLPAGYTYTSAFSLEIFQGEESIPFISEGGNVTVSFRVPSAQSGKDYTLFYWGNGWVPLKGFMLDENGKPRKFNLYTDDPREIISGLNFIFTDGSLRAEISTNFPGIFVLAQR